MDKLDSCISHAVPLVKKIRDYQSVYYVRHGYLNVLVEHPE